jgi:hypothetical protein
LRRLAAIRVGREKSQDAQATEPETPVFLFFPFAWFEN